MKLSKRFKIVTIMLAFFVIIPFNNLIFIKALPEKEYNIYVDGREIYLLQNSIIEKNEMYIVLNDLVKIFGFEIFADKIKNVTSYLSPSLYFTVNNSDGAVTVHGGKTDVLITSIDNIQYIRLEDLSKVIPATVSYKNGRIDITADFDSSQQGAVVHVDSKKVFILSGSYYINKNTAYLSLSSLAQIFIYSKICVKEDSYEISTPIDGSFCSINFDGTIQYKSSENAKLSTTKINPEELFQTIANNQRRVNLNFISEYVKYKTTISYKDGRYYIDVISEWDYITPNELALILDDTPLSSDAPPPVIYSAPTKEQNPAVRDGDYIINYKLQDDIAKEINACRINTGLKPLKINHSLVYKPQAASTPSRNTSFDNMRWCRENLSERTLEHTTLSSGSGEILMMNSKSGGSAVNLVDIWCNSPPHYSVIMYPDFKEFGILVIQYPNGDIDIAGIFCTK